MGRGRWASASSSRWKPTVEASTRGESPSLAGVPRKPLAATMDAFGPIVTLILRLMVGRPAMSGSAATSHRVISSVTCKASTGMSAPREWNSDRAWSAAAVLDLRSAGRGAAGGLPGGHMVLGSGTQAGWSSSGALPGDVEANPMSGFLIRTGDVDARRCWAVGVERPRAGG